MRILLIDVNCKYSSTGKIVYDLYTQINGAGGRAAVLYGRGKKVKGPDIIRFSTRAEVYFHGAMTRLTGLTGYYSFFSTHKLLRFLKAFRPDIVHLNDMHGYYVNILPLLKYLKKKEIPVLWTLHCEYPYTGKCGHSYECTKWKTCCKKCPYLKAYPESLVFDFTRKMYLDKKEVLESFPSLTVVTPSFWLAGRVNESFLARKEIHVIPNGIDTKNIFYPREYDALKELHHLTLERVLLAAAPELMNEEKGGYYVLELAKRMEQEPVTFILVGVGGKEQTFPDNVIALNRTEDQEELAGYYSMADLFLICSKMETLPTTCLEALACGTPIAGFDRGGIKETAPGNLGTFVAYGDVDALYQVVKERLQEKKTQAEKEACVQYAAQHYTKEIMYDNYMALYESKRKDGATS